MLSYQGAASTACHIVSDACTATGYTQAVVNPSDG
jgi:hypothetical protein